MIPTGHRVLLVEDEPLVARSLMLVLRSFHPVHAADVSAIPAALAGVGPVACVLSDLGVPGGGGPAAWDVLERVRPDLLPHFRVLTGGGSSLAHFAAFLDAKKPIVWTKPIDPLTLRLLVQEILDQAQATLDVSGPEGGAA